MSDGKKKEKELGPNPCMDHPPVISEGEMKLVDDSCYERPTKENAGSDPTNEELDGLGYARKFTPEEIEQAREVQRAALLEEEERAAPMPPQIVDHENSSVICPACGGRTALCSALITEIVANQEPYVSGVIEETESGCDCFDTHASVVFYYCETCMGVVDAELSEVDYVRAEKKPEFKQEISQEWKDRIAVQNVRRLPFEIHPRVETGALEFKKDWPGFFLRGDSAMFLAFCIEQALKDMDDIVTFSGANKHERVQARDRLAGLQKAIFDHVYVGGWKKKQETPLDHLSNAVDQHLLMKPVESMHDKMERAMEQVTVQDIATVCEHVIKRTEEEDERQKASSTPEDAPETPKGD